MSLRLGPTSGSYHVQASEQAAGQASRSPGPKTVLCFVNFLDETRASFEIDKRSKGQTLLDQVFAHLELLEKDYFGLQFVDDSPQPEGMRWLEPLKTIRKQIQAPPPYQFYFRVKFYVSDPSKLCEEYTRYHLFLQVKRDITEGRLVVPYRTAVLLASYAVQSELGDYSTDDHYDGYLSPFRFLPDQPAQFEHDVRELHKQHHGQTPADAELLYLEQARSLDMYGVDLHQATDQSHMAIELGVTSTGLVVFHNNIRINTFLWSKIIKISFKRKQFFIQLRKEMDDSVENLIGFNMCSYRSCKNLWKSCVEHHTFFRLQSAPQPKSGLFAISANQGFRFRSGSSQFARRTVAGTTRESILAEPKHSVSLDSFRHAPTTTLSNGRAQPDYRSLDRKERRAVRPLSPPNHNTSRPLSPYEHNSVRPISPASVPLAPPTLVHPISSTNHNAGRPLSPPNHNGSRPLSPATDRSETPVNSSSLYSEGSMRRRRRRQKPTPEVKDSEDGSNYDTAEYSLPNGRLSEVQQGLVTIKVVPDSQGRFGFNVKGGSDQALPVIVSRVAAGSPADLCIPRLNEGDQVLFINGRDISAHRHEQVVQFIRSSRETHSGELVLIVKPNVYIGDDEASELSFIPDSGVIQAPSMKADNLPNSMTLLQECLSTGSLLLQFEQMPRKVTSMTSDCAALEQNMGKNRYRDISPYDDTRVKLKSSGGDYINANFVNMEVPGSGVVNRYIAAQGPLPNTAGDFWTMVWDQHCMLVVMLTATVERGRVKCHTYWPPLYETLALGSLTVTCVRETASPSVCSREFSVVNLLAGGRERLVTQLQYSSWPDHGVPNDPSSFLSFIQTVRNKRQADTAPTVVHCSAGIGRTGVLITMETAMCLIEANQPVNPLEIVKTMREQRAMLIQNTSQFKFVSEAILKVYQERVVQPLPEFSR